MKNLTLEQRQKLEGFVRLNNSYTKKGRIKHITQADMATELGVSQSTVSRELKRNSSPPRYTCSVAHRRALERRLHSKRDVERWYENNELLDDFLEKLNRKWSPDQIMGRRRLEGKVTVSTTTLYEYIRKDRRGGGKLHKLLRYQGRKYKWIGWDASKNRIPDRVDISKRPKEVNEKTSFGHWESDLVVGPMGTKSVVATYAERKSMYFRAIKIKRSAAEMVRATNIVLGQLPQHMRQTMTHDNGSEIARHSQITENLGVKVYCARAYCSTDRALNECMNRELRRFFPKGTDFQGVTQEKIDEAVSFLNNLPRKTLHYRTPEEVFTAA